MGKNNVYRYDINIIKIIFLYFIYLFISNKIGHLLENIVNIFTTFLQCLKTFVFLCYSIFKGKHIAYEV